MSIKTQNKIFCLCYTASFFPLKIRSPNIKETEETKENKSSASKEEMEVTVIVETKTVIILVVLCLH